MIAPPRGADLAEFILASAGHADAQVIIEERAHLDQRWARSTATTNGVTTSTIVTVILLGDRPNGVVSASCSSSVTNVGDIHDLIARARVELAAARNEELRVGAVPERTDADFSDEAPALEADEIAPILARLGRVNSQLASMDIESFGYLERELSTQWLATSTGIRRRAQETTDRLEVTAKSDSRRRSTWHGQATLDIPDEALLIENIARELAWQGVRTDVKPGPQTVLLSASAVADLCIDYLWSSGARDAVEGRTALHDAASASRTRLGAGIVDPRVQMISDPVRDREPRMATLPFALTRASSRYASVLDNGRDLGTQTWIRDGTLNGLHGPTSDADSIGISATPVPGNLVMSVDRGEGSLDDLVANIDDGLVITCLWYIRAVDPQTMTVTGLTRDGVYRVLKGKIVGAASNFRFNDSPLGMLNRIVGAGSPIRTLPREMADYANRVVVPPLVVRDWHLTSVSDAV